jgi:hypothetical protein
LNGGRHVDATRLDALEQLARYLRRDEITLMVGRGGVRQARARGGVNERIGGACSKS